MNDLTPTPTFEPENARVLIYSQIENWPSDPILIERAEKEMRYWKFKNFRSLDHGLAVVLRVFAGEQLNVHLGDMFRSSLEERFAANKKVGAPFRASYDIDLETLKTMASRYLSLSNETFDFKFRFGRFGRKTFAWKVSAKVLSIQEQIVPIFKNFAPDHPFTKELEELFQESSTATLEEYTDFHAKRLMSMTSDQLYHGISRGEGVGNETEENPVSAPGVQTINGGIK